MSPKDPQETKKEEKVKLVQKTEEGTGNAGDCCGSGGENRGDDCCGSGGGSGGGNDCCGS